MFAKYPMSEKYL